MVDCRDEVITRLRARIAELEAALPAWIYDQETGTIHVTTEGNRITEEQIDAAWEIASLPVNEQVFDDPKNALGRIGIFACSKCGGSRWVEDIEPIHVCGGDEERCHRCCPESMRVQIDCPACHRNGKSHGWVLAIDGGDDERTG
jgi:hypothetical protein